MSVSTKVVRLARTSILTRSQPFILRSGNDIKDREEAFENQYVKEKEKNDIRILREKQIKEQQGKQSKSSQSSPKENPNAARIKELENQLAAIQKELNQLRK